MKRTVGEFTFESEVELSSPVCEDIISALTERGGSRLKGVLLGRAPVQRAFLAPFGRVVIKRYLRGGLFRYFVRSHYLRRGASRGEIEYTMLGRAAAVGARVPKPLIYIVRGGLWYQAWLVVEEISHEVNLATLATESADEATRRIPEVAAEIQRLIRARIHHVDLHPGNVIFSADGAPYLIDFDRAVDFVGPMNALRDAYLIRWRRAVIKHELPDSLAEAMCAALRMDFDSARIN